MSAITAKARRKMKKYAVLTREPRCFLGSFDFSWEQRKLGELIRLNGRIGFRGYTEKDIVSKDDGGVLAFSPTNIVDNKLTTNCKNTYITRFKYDESPEIKIHNGDILFVKTGSTLGKSALVTGLLEDATLNPQVVVMRTNKADAEFLAAMLITNHIISQVNSAKIGGAVPTLTETRIKDFDVAIPASEVEKEQIGQFFTRIDNLITLHQRKCALLFSSFQALISMMFTTSTFSWEQRKLGDIADIVGGGTPSTGNPNYWDGDIDWYAPAEIASQIYANSSQKKITDLGYENSSAKMLPPGTVLFTSRAGIGKTAILTRKGCTNQGFQSIVPHRGELDSYFIFSRTEELKRYGELVGAGSTFVEVSGKQMAVMELMMPPTMREQQTIGGFFQQLDHLITLHQRKCISFTGRAGRLISTVNKKRITSSWEQRKLGDVVKEITRNDPESEAPIMMITANNGFIEQSERYAFNNAGESLKKYILLKKGELAYNHGASKLRPYGSCFALTTAENARIPFVYHCFSAENQNAEFMSIELNGAEIENQLRKIVSSGARMDGLLNISFDEYTSVSVLLPGTEEQDRIADFFRHLDNLITLHQRKPFLMKWRTSDANRNQTNRLVL